ncbi:hypothetical protein NX722_14510 [Endozoicomonas gorgoniicola]|uniref:Uncharacterized protein n=1 Tax=Endozoicomonas gorgoniicola TaxID=1234144 RepID=A0ABT3MWQ8_9GAMM|nr:hypothetical protein [Endozoicomonas gorgoniicola]MCW7553817.1 hypothetical protein [Endozoicomonas gorgoniicola]
MKIKLSFLLLFLVMHSQNALSIDFNINLVPDPNPYAETYYTIECCHMLKYDSDTDSVYDSHICYYCNDSFDYKIEKLKEVFSTIVKDMLDAQVTFSGESLPRSTEFNRMVNIANGSSLEYRFTVTQSLGSVIEDGDFPGSVRVQTYQATLSIPSLTDVYTIVGEEALSETQDEDAVEEAPDEDAEEETPDEGTLDEVTDENPVEPTTSNFGNTPDTLPELNPSWWERLTNPFINLLFQQNSR